VGERFSYATSHVGLCVRDLERSRRFYVDGLGFEEFARFEITRPIAEVDPPCDFTSFFIQKGGLRVEASNSHDDFFIKNLVAIRAEARLALAVYRPAAFGTVVTLPKERDPIDTVIVLELEGKSSR